PDPDVGPDVDGAWVGRIRGDGVVLDVDQARHAPGRRAAPLCPGGAVEVPDVAVVADAAERDVDRVAGGVGRVDRDARDRSDKAQGTTGRVVQARARPRGPRLVEPIHAAAHRPR